MSILPNPALSHILNKTENTEEGFFVDWQKFEEEMFDSCPLMKQAASESDYCHLDEECRMRFLLATAFLAWKSERESRALGNVVIAGREIYAGTEEGESDLCRHALVIEFPDKESIKKAIQDGACRFTLFESPEKP